MTTDREQFRISLVKRGVADPEEDVDLFPKDTDVSIATARFKAQKLAGENIEFDVWIQDVFTGGLEVWRMLGGRLEGPIGSVEVLPEAKDTGFVFGLPEEAVELKPSGPGISMRLLFTEGEQTVRTDEFDVPSPAEYEAFLKRIEDDPTFIPDVLPTPGVFVSDIREGIIKRFGSLPPNWESSLRDQLNRAYTGPFNQFIENTGGFGGGRPKGRPRG